MMYVLVYDIVDNNRRNRLHRSLKNFGTAVQRSVFEFDLSAKEVDKLIVEVEKLISAEEDTVRLYRICEGCLPHVRMFGEGRPSLDPEYYIV